MTDGDRDAEILRVVREYSTNEEKIAALECKLRRLGKTMARLGPRLEQDPALVEASDLSDFAHGETHKSREDLEAAYEARRMLSVQLKEFRLDGLIAGS
ncbi:MAG: hypothetical protein OYG32_06210 [Rhodospirillaceae bacterium]|nr:hypothetical protein [Rhodospirillaceae bacterium]MDE0254370.1 hypothetical protein [Rhodospirillaceae bacterium]MDE0617041.1 hypothetical protein [Rhodospirillaceae bacterium]